MSNIQKAAWSTQGDNIRFSVPLTKVDTEKRLVYGFASLDNIDQHGDVVTAQASKSAFERTKAGLREMHDKVAVGKIVDFHEDTYYDVESGNVYQGIYVTAYVSKGAQNTWEKVLDGTLKGFSIGGNIKEADEEWSKDAGRAIRFIKDYELTELSLVDNPANQFANIFAIEKDADGVDSVSGIATDIKTENVFYCETDGLAKAGEADKMDCAACGEGMENIGWFEHDGSNTSELIANAVKKHLHGNAEGGVIVAEETESKVEKAAEVEETPQPVTEEPKAVETSEVEPEAAVEVDEAEGNDLVKTIENFREAVEQQLNGQQEQIQKAVTDLDTKFEEFTKGFEEKFEELSKNHGDLTEKFAGLKTELDSLEKSVDTIGSSTAVKKSGDLGGSTEETVEKSNDSKTSFWGGSFLGE